MTKTTLYSMGTFTEIDSPFDHCKEEDYEKQMEEIGYNKSPEMTIPENHECDFVYFTLHNCAFPSEKEPTYPFYALVELGGYTGRDLFFDSWISVLHFLQNYTSWITNVLKANELQYKCLRKYGLNED